MNAEVMKERLDGVFSNNPAENLDLMSPEIQAAIGDAIEEKTEVFLSLIQRDGCTEKAIMSGLFGVAGQAFFAGHNYAVEHGNLTAEMKKVV